MKTIDHKIFANYLACNLNTDTPQLYKNAFILGNTVPDWNALTYLHGFFKGQKFHGHNYENVQPVIAKMYHGLKQKKQWGLYDYYVFGKLMHYVTDSFTYPHHGTYEGTLGEHCAYEEKLHETFLQALQLHDFSDSHVQPFKNLDEMEVMHQSYIENAGECAWDCRFIFRATEAMLQLEVKDEAYGKVQLPKASEA